MSLSFCHFKPWYEWVFNQVVVLLFSSHWKCSSYQFYYSFYCLNVTRKVTNAFHCLTASKCSKLARLVIDNPLIVGWGPVSRYMYRRYVYRSMHLYQISVSSKLKSPKRISHRYRLSQHYQMYRKKYWCAIPIVYSKRQYCLICRLYCVSYITTTYVWKY